MIVPLSRRQNPIEIYAKLIIEELDQPYVPDDIGGIFNSLPMNLGGVYEAILKRINNSVSTTSAQSFAKTIFRYLAFSFVSLRMDQLQQLFHCHIFPEGIPIPKLRPFLTASRKRI